MINKKPLLITILRINAGATSISGIILMSSAELLKRKPSQCKRFNNSRRKTYVYLGSNLVVKCSKQLSNYKDLEMETWRMKISILPDVFEGLSFMEKLLAGTMKAYRELYKRKMSVSST